MAKRRTPPGSPVPPANDPKKKPKLPNLSLESEDVFADPSESRPSGQPLSSVVVSGEPITGLGGPVVPRDPSPRKSELILGEPISGVTPQDRPGSSAQRKSELILGEPISGITPQDRPGSGARRKSELILGEPISGITLQDRPGSGAQRKSELVMGEPISGLASTSEPMSGARRKSEIVMGEPITGVQPVPLMPIAPKRSRRKSEVNLGDDAPPSDIISGVNLPRDGDSNVLLGDLPHDSDEIGLPESAVHKRSKKSRSPVAPTAEMEQLVEFDDLDESAIADQPVADEELDISALADDEVAEEAVDAFEDEVAEAAEEVEEPVDAFEEELAEEVDAAAEEVADDGIVPEEDAVDSLFDDDAVASTDDALVDDDAVGSADEALEDDDALVADESESGFLDSDDEPTDKKKKKKKKPLDDDEEEEITYPRQKPAPPPNYGRRWFGGVVLGTLLTAGAVGGVWYMQPELLTEYAGKSPNAPKDSTGMILKAMLEKDYDTVINNVKDTSEDKFLLLRGEAKFRKFVIGKKEVIAPADAKEKDVVEALKDLERDDKFAYRQAVRLLDEAKNKAGLKVLEDIKDVAKLKDLAEVRKVVLASLDDAKTLDKAKDDLVVAKMLAKKDDFQEAVLTKVIQDVKKTNDILETHKIAETGADGVAKLSTAKKDVDVKIDAVDKILVDQKLAKQGAEGVTLLVESRDKFKKDFDDTKVDRDDLEMVVKESYKEFEDGKIVEQAGKEARKELVAASKLARKKAESPLALPLEQLARTFGGLGTDAGGALSVVFDRTAKDVELATFKLREPLIEGPAQQLETLAKLLLQRDYKDAADLDKAAKTATWVLDKEAGSPPEIRGKALLVQGLSARNQEKFEEARVALGEASKELQKANAAPWGDLAQRVQADLVDPNKYYLPRIAEQYNKGLDEVEREKPGLAKTSFEQAVTEAEQALRALPNHPLVRVQRGLAKLHAARKGELTADVLAQLRQDIDAGKSDPKAKAEATFLAGLLEEATGNAAAAETQLREAVRIADPAQKGRYLLALGRLLQGTPVGNPFPEGFQAPAPAPIGQGKQPPAAKISYVHPVDHLFAAFAIGQFDFEDEDARDQAKRVQASIEVAKEMILSPDEKTRGHGHLLLGKAYSKRGDNTQALKEFAQGIKILHGKAGTDLGVIIDEHPALQIPDAFKKNNPLVAEQFFGEGLHYFWERRFKQAEENFTQAVSYYREDARYHYFLALAITSQGDKKREKSVAFHMKEGARLEAFGRPGKAEVNASLERLQGSMRQTLNEYRAKALSGLN